MTPPPPLPLPLLRQASPNCRFELGVLLECPHKPFVVAIGEANPRAWATPEFAAVTRLGTQLYADLSAASTIDTTSPDAPALMVAELLAQPSALPALLRLLQQLRCNPVPESEVSGAPETIDVEARASVVVSKLFTATSAPLVQQALRAAADLLGSDSPEARVAFFRAGGVELLIGPLSDDSVVAGTCLREEVLSSVLQRSGTHGALASPFSADEAAELFLRSVEARGSEALCAAAGVPYSSRPATTHAFAHSSAASSSAQPPSGPQAPLSLLHAPVSTSAGPVRGPLKKSAISSAGLGPRAPITATGPSPGKSPAAPASGLSAGVSSRSARGSTGATWPRIGTGAAMRASVALSPPLEVPPSPVADVVAVETASTDADMPLAGSVV
jgi:hypothetical protein